jgi:hypothetical protein
MRIAAAALALASCSGGAEPGIDCAIGGGAFERDCMIERNGDHSLILRHRDGGFRRLQIKNRNPVAADGAEPARVTSRADGVVEIAIGGDRYRVPAEALR